MRISGGASNNDAASFHRSRAADGPAERETGSIRPCVIAHLH